MADLRPVSWIFQKKLRLSFVDYAFGGSNIGDHAALEHSSTLPTPVVPVWQMFSPFFFVVKEAARCCHSRPSQCVSNCWMQLRFTASTETLSFGLFGVQWKESAIEFIDKNYGGSSFS